jgi:hypothetical protein
MVKKTTEQFIEDAKNVHGDKYDYSLVEYVGSHSKIKIICKEHGVFEQSSTNHLSGGGCPICCNNVKLTTEEFIKRAKKLHGDKYDYSLVDYKNARSKVIITCPIHGEFQQFSVGHLNGKGCRKCGGTDKSNTKNFIEKAKEIHNDKYNYSLVDYKNNRTKVKIICPIHGEFEQEPHSHLSGCGCKKCAGLNKLTTKEFIDKSIKIHNNKYDYCLVEYKNYSTKVKIICPIHGEFEQIPLNHFKGKGCKFCSTSKGELKVKYFLEEKNIKYISQYRFIDCRNIKPLPFDFYLPEYNMCIEYDGEQHFKPFIWDYDKKNFKKTKKHDEIKNQYCLKNNIKLIRIKYDQNVNDYLTDLIGTSIILIGGSHSVDNSQATLIASYTS